VIDATGDGIVAAQSGVPWEQGDGDHPYAMALTKVFRLGGVEFPEGRRSPEEVAVFRKQLADAVNRGEFKTGVLMEQNRLVNYYTGNHWRLPDKRSEMMCVLSRVLKVDPLDPADFTRAEREGREQACEAAEALIRYAPGFENAYLLDTSAQVGLRSSRRLHGIATVTEQDAREFRKYPDGVARSSWNIDIWPSDSYHAPAVDRSTEAYKKRKAQLIAGEYFDIRYGCIVAEGIDNLLLAGRCVSAEHVPESSLRIQQTCMSLGQAAGTAAALSLQAKSTPRELDASLLVKQLEMDRDVNPAFEELKNGSG
jgi:hypothetical protein